MEKWFDSFEKLDSVFNLFFNVRYMPDMYLENQFLNLAQAAESYHRRKTCQKRNLKDRLIELFESIPEITDQLIKDKEGVANKVKDIRNYFTHYNNKLNNNPIQTEELYWFIELLSFILQACFLTELFDSKECYQLLNRNDRYQKTVEILRNKIEFYSG